MKFVSLIDSHSQNVVTINPQTNIIRVEIDEIAHESRLSPFMTAILYEFFKLHPTPISYDDITKILCEYNLSITDHTRMHRKISQIRQAIGKIHPFLKNIIINSRGTGYSLPLHFRRPHHEQNHSSKITFSNKHLQKALKNIEDAIHDTINILPHQKVIKSHQGYIIDRSNLTEIIAKKIAKFTECEKIILREIRMHEADFTSLRINYYLAKIKTYIGLARISEYPISEPQWYDWFKQEVWIHFSELLQLIKTCERS